MSGRNILHGLPYAHSNHATTQFHTSRHNINYISIVIDYISVSIKPKTIIIYVVGPICTD